jgi:hypothetical protein
MRLNSSQHTDQGIVFDHMISSETVQSTEIGIPAQQPDTQKPSCTTPNDTAFDLDIFLLVDEGRWLIEEKAADMVSTGSLTTLDGLPNEVQVEIAQHLMSYAYLAAAGAGVVPTTQDLNHRANIWTSVCRCDTLFNAAITVGANLILIGRDLKKFEGAQYLAIVSLDWTGDMVFKLPEETRLLDLFHPGELKSEDLTLSGAQISINISDLIKQFVAIDPRIDIPEPDSSTVKNYKQLYKEEDGQIKLDRLHLTGPPTIDQLGCRKSENFRSMFISTRSLNRNSGDWLEALGWDTLISSRHVILRRDWPASGQIRYYLRWEGQWESIDLLID